MYRVFQSRMFRWGSRQTDHARTQVPRLRFLPAVQFLTILPVRRGFTPAEVGHSTAFFPVVGLIIGLILVVINYFLVMFLPVSVANVFLLISMVIVTGAIRMDGLVDTCDGIARPPDG